MAPTDVTLRRVVATGLVAGAVIIYLVMVGLVSAFERRPAVSDLFSVGQLMLATAPFVAGVVLGRRMRRGGRALATTLGAAALAGAIAGAVLGAWVLVASVVNLGGVFIAVRQPLIDFITFDLGLVAVPLLVGIGAALALAGALVERLDPRDRSAVYGALAAVVIVTLLEPLLSPIFSRLDLRWLGGFLYRGGGLSMPGAAAVLVGVGALTWAWKRPAAAQRERLAALPAEQRRGVSIGLVAFALLILLIIPQVGGGFVSLVLVQVGFALMLALGLNIVVGYAGLLDLGYVAFYAVGAYTMAILTAPSSALSGAFATTFGVEWGFWLALPVVMVVAGIVGIFIGAPVLRLRGDYLAIVTLGFGEIARILFLSDALKPWVGGSQGIVGIPNLHIPIIGIEFTRPEQFFYPVLAFSGVAAFVAWRLAHSRTGRAWNAMREDEEVAESTGVNTTRYKLLAFALGATLGCLGGALFAVQLGSVFPNTFNILVSITTLAIIILGGMGSIPGVVVGALLLIGLPELLREFEQFRLLVYGAVLVAMMILRPEGLFPSRTRQMELHEDTDPEDRDQLGESDGELRATSGPVTVRAGSGDEA